MMAKSQNFSRWLKTHDTASLSYQHTAGPPQARLLAHPRHVFDKASVYALAAAEAANRPLLVRGEPGTGKSQLARAAAVARKRLFLSVVVNARTKCQDLQWQFDAVGRLGEAQTLAHVPDGDPPASGPAPFCDTRPIVVGV